jgi:hypothetical protein
MRTVLLVSRASVREPFSKTELRVSSSDSKKSLLESSERAVLRSSGGMPSMPVAVLFFKDFKAAVSSEEEKGRSDGREDIGKGSGGLDGKPLLKRPVKVLPFVL